MYTGVLTQPTLVLNRSWTAISTTTVRKAMGLLFSGAAKAVRPETYEVHDFASWADLAVAPEEPCVATVALRIRVPEVILLTRFDGVPRRPAAFTRKNLFRRDHHTCQYCGKRPGDPELTIDHVTPRSRGGRSTWENCVLACVACNRRKSNRLPREAGMLLATRPSAPRWAPRIELRVGRVRESWERFVSDRYWNAPLEP